MYGRWDRKSKEALSFFKLTFVVIKKSKIGWNEINRIGGSIVALSFIFIEDINIIGNYYEIQGATFQNYGKEKITYFGDITINWDFKNKGEITMTVKNNQSATMAEYQELTGGSIQNVVTSLVKEGK